MLPPEGSRLRRAADGDGNAVDRLRSLPEELLLHILGDLGSVRDAIRTGVLSRQWRGLWASLPDLVFDGVDPGLIEPVLAQVTPRPALDLLSIRLELDCSSSSSRAIERQRLSSLLSAAALLAPRNLVLSTDGWPRKGDGAVVNLPCLDRTVSLTINSTWETPLAPPPPSAGEFAMLRSLSLRWCSVDTNALLPLCPQLRSLALCNCLSHAWGNAVIHSSSLEELVLRDDHLESIDIVAPVLKKVKVKVQLSDPVQIVSLSVPKVEASKWRFIFYDSTEVNVALFGLWGLDSVCQRIVGEHLAFVEMELTAYAGPIDQEYDLADAIAQLPVTNFSALDLDIVLAGHVYAPLVLHLLGIQPAIQMLNLLLRQEEEEISSCPVNCPCEHSIDDDWRSQSVALTNLKVIEIVGLEGRDHEVDFLKLLFRCATALKKIIVRFSNNGGVSTRDSACEKISSLFNEYPNVTSFIYINNIDTQQRNILTPVEGAVAAA